MTVEPAEHRTRAGEFRRHARGDVWGWKTWNFTKKQKECQRWRAETQRGREMERGRGGTSTALLCIITY